MSQLDEIDLQVLHILQEDGRISNADLAQRIGLTAPSALRRVKLLEERGYIKGYAALLDPLKIGISVTAFVFVETVAGRDLDVLANELAAIQDVQEIHKLIGEWCFLLKVRTKNPQTLEDLVYGTLRKHPSIRRSRTTLATSSAYETTALPLPQIDFDRSTEQV